jgi:Mn2+/Fe2+ NRAMP family transporter
VGGSWNEILVSSIIPHVEFTQAKKFYAIIATFTIRGLWINFTNIDPIKALVYTAVINGIVAVPVFMVVMKIANDRKILKEKINGKISNIIGCLTILIMAISIVMLFLSWHH